MPDRETISATVTNVDDPAKAGRIKVAMPQMDGDEYPEWIEPIFPPGWITMPEPGDTVELDMPVGEDIVEFAHEVRYKGKRLDDTNPVPSEFKTNYPKRRGYKTAKGHLIIFDDKDGTVNITNGVKSTKIDLDSSGNIIITVTSLLKLGGSTATHPVMFGDTFNLADNTVMTALSVYIALVGAAFTAMVGDPFLASLQTATKTAMTAAGTGGSGTATAAIATFLAAASTWLSAVVKSK